VDYFIVLAQCYSGATEENHNILSQESRPTGQK